MVIMCWANAMRRDASESQRGIIYTPAGDAASGFVTATLRSAITEAGAGHATQRSLSRSDANWRETARKMREENNGH